MTWKRLVFLLGVALGAVALAAPAASAQQRPLGDCFWLGPSSFRHKAVSTSDDYDGHWGAYPEAQAQYWLARFRLNEGDVVTLNGFYPKARYQSLVLYGTAGGSPGVPQSSIRDDQIAPDPGSSNPFLPGAARYPDRRAWTLRVVKGPAPQVPAPNTLYSPTPVDQNIEMILRIYEPERGEGILGGVPLPRPTLRRADGSVRRGLRNVCQQINGADRTFSSILETMSVREWLNLYQKPGANFATTPALTPPRWDRFFGQQCLLQSFNEAAGLPRDNSQCVDGLAGFYSNFDSRYVHVYTSDVLGAVQVTTGRMPTFVRTFNHRRHFPAAARQVRYWSYCTYESNITLYGDACLTDRDVPLRAGRRYTIVASKRAKRPANAIAKCGYAWVATPRHGDHATFPNASDPTRTHPRVRFAERRAFAWHAMRQLYANPNFNERIANVQAFGQEQAVMGAYYPTTTYSSKRAFEARGCPRRRGSARARTPPK
jgi:hypothetical protein